MNVFTDVYEKSVELLQSPSLHSDWRSVESGLKSLLQPDGPVATEGKSLDLLRKTLDTAATKAGGLRAKAKAREILRACEPGKNGFQDRAALIKQLKHFYLVERKGNQSIWVVDQPKKLGKWNYLLFAGKSSDELAPLLAQSGEVFGAGNRKMLSDALQQARKWSADTEVKLSSKSPKTLDCIRSWFHESGASDEAVETTRVRLLNGFRKITAACNSGRVIFSDRPHLRASGDYDNTFASVNAGDAMPVIYIYQLFLDTGRRTLFGKIPKMWLCALTIIHELTHKLEATEDIRYDYQGLLPSPSFPAGDTIRNADSWAYFCGDLLGQVPSGALKEARS
jgi:hypothetical protein